MRNAENAQAVFSATQAVGATTEVQAVIEERNHMKYDYELIIPASWALKTQVESRMERTGAATRPARVWVRTGPHRRRFCRGWTARKDSSNNT
jgi:hypothetical protein